jgi:Raf kinase inhibitor-like YbhB/YbcL family protein
MKRVTLWMVTAVFVSVLPAMGQTPTTAPPAAAFRPLSLALTTSGFEDGGIVPLKYSAASKDPAVSPDLSWTNVPAGTVSFALLVTDPDGLVDKSLELVMHWMIFNIPGTAHSIPEGVPAQPRLPDGTIQARNRRGTYTYMGMGATNNGPYHHYIWTLYALDTKLPLGPDATQKEIFAAMDGHILGKGVLVGRFRRPS